MKKAMLMLAAAGSTAIALAEDTVSTDALDTALNTVQTTLTGYASKVLPILAAVVVAGLAIWFLPKAVRILKRVFGQA